MNTRIARRLNEARKSANDAMLSSVASEMVKVYNQSIVYGYIEGLIVSFVKVTPYDNETVIDLVPTCGMISIDDLYNMKTVWGADDVIVVTGDKGVFGLCFKIR